jgi:hypothetical protein
MASRNDITLAWAWLSLGDPDVDSLAESELHSESRSKTDAPQDTASTSERMGQYLAAIILGRFLQ